MSERVRIVAAVLGTLALVLGAARAPRRVSEQHEVASNAGAWLVRYSTEPAEIPLGVPFDVELEVRAAPGREVEGRDSTAELELSFDARMPEHRHGMRVRPTIERTGDGRFRVRGARLHMPGSWELHFDLTEGAITERAQVRVELE